MTASVVSRRLWTPSSVNAVKVGLEIRVNTETIARTTSVETALNVVRLKMVMSVSARKAFKDCCVRTMWTSACRVRVSLGFVSILWVHLNVIVSAGGLVLRVTSDTCRARQTVV